MIISVADTERTPVRSDSGIKVCAEDALVKLASIWISLFGRCTGFQLSVHGNKRDDDEWHTHIVTTECEACAPVHMHTESGGETNELRRLVVGVF